MGDFEFDLNLRAKFFRKPWPRGFSYSTNNIIKAFTESVLPWENRLNLRAKFALRGIFYELNLRANFFKKPWPGGFSYSTNSIIKAISALDCLERIDWIFHLCDVVERINNNIKLFIQNTTSQEKFKNDIT